MRSKFAYGKTLGSTMKVAIVSFSIGADKKGGVWSVVQTVIRYLETVPNLEINLITFDNEIKSSNSVTLHIPKTYKNSRRSEMEYFSGHRVIRFGSFAAEFETARYRNRKELSRFFDEYDFILVVSGFLQFVNVIPKVNTPIFVQCATRLKWERESQYLSMSVLRRMVLKLQKPLLWFIEKKVLKRDLILMAENARMKKWLDSQTDSKTHLWLPGINRKHSHNNFLVLNSIKGHFVSVGRLNEARKGWSRLLEAYAHAYEQSNSIPKLIIIGHGEFSFKDSQTFKKYQNYPIQIHRDLSDFERDEFLRSGSFFLQTSYEEGLGIAALEAMSLGLPLICSKTDGAKEYLTDGINGSLIDQDLNFIENFAREIVRSQKWDYEKLSRASRKIFESTFSDNVSLNSLLKIISTTIKLPC